MRILTNYLQILAISLSYNLQFPSYMTSIFSSVQSAGGAQDVFLSFDCLLLNTRATEIFDNISFLKVICLALIPPMLLIVSVTFYVLLFFSRPKVLFRLIWVTLITILFLFYPSLTQHGLTIFRWNDIGGGDNRVQMDVTQEWWGPQHMKWVWSLGKTSSLIFRCSNGLCVHYTSPYSRIYCLIH